MCGVTFRDKHVFEQGSGLDCLKLLLLSSVNDVMLLVGGR